MSSARWTGCRRGSSDARAMSRARRDRSAAINTIGHHTRRTASASKRPACRLPSPAMRNETCGRHVGELGDERRRAARTEDHASERMADRGQRPRPGTPTAHPHWRQATGVPLRKRRRRRSVVDPLSYPRPPRRPRRVVGLDGGLVPARPAGLVESPDEVDVLAESDARGRTRRPPGSRRPARRWPRPARSSPASRPGCVPARARGRAASAAPRSARARWCLACSGYGVRRARRADRRNGGAARRASRRAARRPSRRTPPAASSPSPSPAIRAPAGPTLVSNRIVAPPTGDGDASSTTTAPAGTWPSSPWTGTTTVTSEAV